MMKLNIQMFASTNKTTNYDLPQFVGTDKPTWLGDFNTAMSAIDTGMAENKSDIESMDSRVTNAEASASQASQSVSALTTTVGDLSTDVASVTTTANNAQSTATSALNTANTANGKADTNATNITAINNRINTLVDKEKYSTSEIKTNKLWINNKPIYRKTIYITGLPNNTDKNVNHDTSNIDLIVNTYGIMLSSNSLVTPLNMRGTAAIYGNHTVVYRVDKTQIHIGSDADMSSNVAYITIEYTKTTD